MKKNTVVNSIDSNINKSVKNYKNTKWLYIHNIALYSMNENLQQYNTKVI